jgi:sarcosine oxidase
MVICSDGSRQRYDHAIASVGHRVATLIAALGPAVTPARITSYWLPCQPSAAIGSPPGYQRTASAAFTFLPARGGRHVKITRDVTSSATSAADWPISQEPSRLPDDLAGAVAGTLPAVRLEPEAARTYIEGYTSDRVPLLGQVAPSLTVLAGFSGTGFSKSPVYGDIAADFALLGQTTRPVGFMAPGRRP